MQSSSVGTAGGALSVVVSHDFDRNGRISSLLLVVYMSHWSKYAQINTLTLFLRYVAT